jgi:hypothetical protein
MVAWHVPHAAAPFSCVGGGGAPVPASGDHGTCPASPPSGIDCPGLDVPDVGTFTGVLPPPEVIVEELPVPEVRPACVGSVVSSEYPHAASAPRNVAKRIDEEGPNPIERMHPPQHPACPGMFAPRSALASNGDRIVPCAYAFAESNRIVRGCL